MDIEVGPVLESISAQAPPDLKPFFADFHALYEQKIVAPVDTEVGRILGTSRIEILHRSLIPSLHPWEMGQKDEPTKLCQIHIAAGKEMPRSEAIELLDKTLESIKSSLQPDKEAIITLAMESAQYRLLDNDLSSVKTSLE